MKTRILIVEDDSALLTKLKAHYRTLFERKGHHLTVEQAGTIDEARSLAKAAKNAPYDLVSLDVNLGDSDLTGLDVLSTLGRFHSAWMVVLLTGVETDTTVDTLLGKKAGTNLRKQLRRDAYSRFPAERLLVVEKPADSLSKEVGDSLLSNRLEQIVSVYEEVSRSRYIFRPIDVISMERVRVAKGEKPKKKFIETVSTHWQIRFDCGDMRTLPDKTGFKILHHLLALDRAESLTPEAALLVEPKNERGNAAPAGTVEDPVTEYFVSKGIVNWPTMDESSRNNLIQAALGRSLPRYVALRDLQEEDDLSPNEEDEFATIIKELGPLVPVAETAYLRLRKTAPKVESDELDPGASIQQGFHIAGGNYERRAGQRGEDSPDAMAFRARMKRVKDCLRENGFAAFADHLDDYLTSTGANWSYNPPQGFEWTT
jgi:CheY-like chemotaxis protein